MRNDFRIDRDNAATPPAFMLPRKRPSTEGEREALILPRREPPPPGGSAPGAPDRRMGRSR
jgi:hypothetical protein